MKIYKDIKDFKGVKNPIVTSGTFDGVHLGHKKILNNLVQIGSDNQAETVLITFFPHPRLVLFPAHELKLINNIDENINLLKDYGIDHLIIQKFDKLNTIKTG